MEALALLLGGASSIGEDTSRSVLGQMNDLLRNSRRLTARRAELQAALGAGSLEALEAERSALALRVREATDPSAQAVFRQSLELCEARLRGAQELQPAVDRIEAQQHRGSARARATRGSAAAGPLRRGDPGQVGLNHGDTARRRLPAPGPTSLPHPDPSPELRKLIDTRGSYLPDAVFPAIVELADDVARRMCGPRKQPLIPERPARPPAPPATTPG